MTKREKNNLFGLLGKNISYSFSKGYFTEKFKKLKLDNHQYLNFDISNIQEFKNVKQQELLKGLNVTIPYKQEVIQYLDALDNTAKKIGAVNTIKFFEDGILKGFNTDAYGFKYSLKPLLKKHHNSALILGTGGASKAVAFVLESLEIHYLLVSRNSKNKDVITYDSLTEEIIENHKIIINCTPLGTSPKIELCPNIPYHFLSDNHLLFDLIYNPSISKFLSKGLEKGATIKNGLEMLELQAEESWRIWNS